MIALLTEAEQPAKLFNICDWQLSSSVADRPREHTPSSLFLSVTEPGLPWWKNQAALRDLGRQKVYFTLAGTEEITFQGYFPGFLRPNKDLLDPRIRKEFPACPFL
ncbi:uncharacterized protein LOC132667179 isoform X2 [Panthera onca]